MSSMSPVFLFFVIVSGTLVTSQQHSVLSSNALVPALNQDNPAFHGCEKDLTPPNERDPAIRSYIIDLDAPPKQRWSAVVKDKKEQMLSLLATVRANMDAWFGKKMFELVDEYLPLLARTLPAEYLQEMEGMAEATNVTLGEVTLFNVFYEFFTVCTSIVAQTEQGEIFHARNLDFGIFLGWDIKNKTWMTTEHLRPLVVELDFHKNNKTLYRTINFAGYLGVLTGMKPGKFSLTINERFRLNGGTVGVLEWVLGLRSQNWIGFLTRRVMETANTYQEAQKVLAKSRLVSPVYFILSGTKPNQGCIITRGRKSFDITSLPPTGDWFIVQTNYDHWKQPPFFDDRVTPATTCLKSLGREDMNKTLYNVLSTRPVLNKLTVYTSVLQTSRGVLSTWIQNCADPCWPW